jgi:beta-lactamase class A
MKFSRSLAPLVLLLCASVCAADDAGLKVRLEPLAHGHKGNVAIAVKHLVTGETYGCNDTVVMPTASLIKIAVMVETYQQAADGKIKLTEMLTLREEDKVPGSGILTDNFTAGATFSLRDAVRLMMAHSDNTATNMVLDKVGLANVNKRMEDLGCPNTRINAKVFRGDTSSIDPMRTKKYGLGSTTAAEMVGLLEKLHQGKLVNADACKAMREHLTKCTDRDRLPRFLPPKTEVAHKTGTTNNIRTDAGIIETPTGPVAVCILTAENEDQRWETDNAGTVLCGKVAREVYDHFAIRRK